MENTVSINRTSVCELVRLKLVTWESCEDHAGVGLHSVCVCVCACARMLACSGWGPVALSEGCSIISERVFCQLSRTSHTPGYDLSVYWRTPETVTE